MTTRQTEIAERDERQVKAGQALPDADERLKRAAGLLARAALRASLVQADPEAGGGAEDEA